MDKEPKNTQQPTDNSDSGSQWKILEEVAESKESAPVKVDLKTPEYDEKFKNAEFYVKKAKVQAEQITEEGLKNGAYADKDIRFDEATGGYVVDTYVMRVNPETGAREAALEDTRAVKVGDWIATNPQQEAGDHPNNYTISNETFQKRYEATDEPGVFRSKGKARIIKNETGKSVVVDSPWGGTQEGDANCYFCAACDDESVESISPTKRYILSENDFATYAPAHETE